MARGRDAQGQPGKRGTRGHAVHYSVPMDYWLLGVTQSANRYHQSVAGLNQDYVYSGRSENAEIKLSRLLHRNASQKTSVSLKGWLRRSSNFIDDTEVETQRRATGGWELGLAHKAFAGNSTLDVNITHKRGTAAFGAIPAPEEAFDEGTSRMRITTLDVNLNAPFTLAEQKLRYGGALRVQRNGTMLTPQDRFAIGGRYSVRGFDGESSLSAERGWFSRNDLGWTLGDAEAYLGVDYGSVSGPSTQFLVGRHLAGAVLGVRGNLKGIAQGVATLTAAGMGAAVGGVYGAASAATVDANNRQLHATERKKAEELSKKSGGRYTQQQIEDAMRNSGNSARGENITAGMVLDPNNPNPVYDSGAVFQSTGSGVVQELPNNGYVDPELAAFIQTNTGSGASPYAWSDAQQGKTLPMPANPNAHLNTMTPNVKGYVTPEAAAGLSPVREAIRDENDIRTDVADLAAGTGRVAGVVAASSTTAATVPGPHQPGAAATALTATGVGFAAGAIEQLARPDVGKGLNDFMSTILQEQIDRKLPIAAPFTNETFEYWKKSGSSLGFESWMSNQWSEFLKSKESK